MSSKKLSFNVWHNYVCAIMLLIILSSLPYHVVHAQCANSITTTPAMPPAAKLCNPYTLVLNLEGSGVGATEPVTWSITIPTLPMGTLGSIGLSGSMSANGKTYTIQGTPTMSGTFNLHVVINCTVANCLACPAGIDCSGCLNSISRDIPIVVNTQFRDPADVMLVLDISGSMNQLVPGTASMTKWAVLKSSVQSFLQKYKNWGECGDRIGVTYFDDNRQDFSGGTGLLLFNSNPSPIPMTGAGSIQADMNAKSPGSTTCIGGGILAGFRSFDAMHTNRNLILFTDGIQNMEPSVNTTTMVINDYNLRPDGTGFPAPPLDLKAPPLAYRTFTVGIGDNAVTSLLNSIALAPTNNNYDGQNFPINTTNNLATTLDLAFTQSFVEALSQFSPQLVDIRRINISSQASTNFTVNPSADKLMITVVADPDKLSHTEIQVEKDGRNLSSLIQPGGPTFRSFFVDTTMVKRYNIALDGEWTVRVTGSGTYQVTGMINDEELEAKANLGSVQYAPGDTVKLEAILSYEGHPVKNASRAVVRVAKPGQDVNDLFSNAASVDMPDNFPGEKGNDPGQAKYEALLALNPSFVSSLQPVEDSIPLANDGNGKYTARFSDTKESGIYTFIFKLSGNDSTTGAYDRFILRSTVIDFGSPDKGSSVFQVIKRDGLSYFQLIPKNRFGHLLGPNRLNQVQFLIDGKPLLLKDNLDGSYEASVPTVNADTKVDINIKGESFFKDDYSEVEGNDLPIWSKYPLWIIILIILFILLLIYLVRRKK